MEFRIRLKNVEDSMKEKQNFLDNELNNNKEKEKKISMAERNAARLRLEYQDNENTRVQFQDEVSVQLLILKVDFLDDFYKYVLFSILIDKETH